MAETPKPAPAKPVIKGGRLVSMRSKGAHPTKTGKKALAERPNFIFDGPKPKVGEELTFELDNKVSYTGKVAEVVSVGKENCVEFDGPINPQT